MDTGPPIIESTSGSGAKQNSEMQYNSVKPVATFKNGDRGISILVEFY